ncbi:hypothetical protein BEWA_028130 [Theileria equi strain WA]|uniref:Uncharacterized protein n=1 Tax=Theileria equi strain WA TaxID=1537102 RepID=L0AYK9_THEEQ|nr:hypothetical protein BEWA_028130 [Theileria equi strain WA]AFZ79964.1 hypothetical protein BEWA_028130 [Theileria equi strain WA]|eukprot:XP_004829630.1 hypothetical protein BEWA_028130 [Theileria equi strain WA]
MESRNEKDLAVERLQNALLKLPRDDLVKLLKNTYQAMRIKHSIPHEKKAPEPAAETAKLHKKSAKYSANSRAAASGTPKAKTARQRSDSVNSRPTNARSAKPREPTGKQEDKRRTCRIKNKGPEVELQDTHCSSDPSFSLGEFGEQLTFRKSDKVPKLDLELVNKAKEGLLQRASEDPMTPTFSPKRSGMDDRDIQNFQESCSIRGCNVEANGTRDESDYSAFTDCSYSMHPDVYSWQNDPEHFGYTQPPFAMPAQPQFGGNMQKFVTACSESSYKMQTQEMYSTSTRQEPFVQVPFGAPTDPFYAQPREMQNGQVREPYGKYSMVPVNEHGQPLYNAVPLNLYHTPKICVKGPFFSRTRVRF